MQAAAQSGDQFRLVNNVVVIRRQSELILVDAGAGPRHQPTNMAVFAQWSGVFAGVEDDVTECFRNGGGVPYEKYQRFHAVMREDSGQSVLSSVEPHVLPLVSGLADRLAAGIRVLDAGCGSGRIVNHLATAFPKSQFLGIDLSMLPCRCMLTVDPTGATVARRSEYCSRLVGWLDDW